MLNLEVSKIVMNYLLQEETVPQKNHEYQIFYYFQSVSAKLYLDTVRQDDS